MFVDHLQMIETFMKKWNYWLKVDLISFYYNFNFLVIFYLFAVQDVSAPAELIIPDDNLLLVCETRCKNGNCILKSSICKYFLLILNYV